ncbi:hypothetical protein EDD85DRAFT_871523 [Armillaria nabsnona]|nr:hypothetical protein EDD85DRAFT_871523 [Armillaria nabsnona]
MPKHNLATFSLSNLLVSYSILVDCYLRRMEGNRIQSASITLSVLLYISTLQTVRRHGAGHAMYSAPPESYTIHSSITGQDERPMPECRNNPCAIFCLISSSTTENSRSSLWHTMTI